MRTPTQRKHSIQVVANRTGLSADVIRAWERRYKAVSPERSETLRRLYTDEDVERLRLLREATLAGRRIGDVAHLQVEALRALVIEDSRENARLDRPTIRETSRGAPLYLERCLRAATSMDSRELEIQLNRAALELDVASLMERVLSPLLKQVGELWLEGKLSIAHEHMTTSLVRALLDSLRGAFSRPSADLTLVATTPAGQHHELGALKVAVLGAVEGWQSTFLGANLPAREIAAAAVELGARVVALSVVYPERDPALESELDELGALLPGRARLIVGGDSAHHYESIVSRSGGVVRDDMESLRRELRQIAAFEARPNRAVRSE